jgi:hypothetical protein
MPTGIATRDDLLAELAAIDELLDEIGDVEDERAYDEVRIRQERVREAMRVNGYA